MCPSVGLDHVIFCKAFYIQEDSKDLRQEIHSSGQTGTLQVFANFVNLIYKITMNTGDSSFPLPLLYVLPSPSVVQHVHLLVSLILIQNDVCRFCKRLMYLTLYN